MERGDQTQRTTREAIDLNTQALCTGGSPRPQRRCERERSADWTGPLRAPRCRCCGSRRLSATAATQSCLTAVFESGFAGVVDAFITDTN